MVRKNSNVYNDVTIVVDYRCKNKRKNVTSPPKS